jgi:hypothetical protein
LALALLSDVTNKRKVIGFDTFEGHAALCYDEYDVRGQNMRNRRESESASGTEMAFADFDECRHLFNSSLITGHLRNNCLSIQL